MDVRLTSRVSDPDPFWIRVQYRYGSLLNPVPGTGTLKKHKKYKKNIQNVKNYERTLVNCSVSDPDPDGSGFFRQFGSGFQKSGSVHL